MELPDGHDLNSYFKQYTKEDFQKIIDAAKPYFDLEIERIMSLPPNLRITQIQKILPQMGKLSEFKRSLYKDQISKGLKITKKTLEVGINCAERGGNEEISFHEVTDPPYTEEQKQQALKLLHNPNFLEEFLNASEKMGCVGEENNKLLVYFTLTSRILDDPINLIVKGESSGGKSYLVDIVKNSFPADEVKAFTTVTPKALFHRTDSLAHKALIIFERPGAEESDYSIRSLQSEKKLIISMSVKNPETQEWETIDHEVPGPVAYIETTTRTHLHPENETRCFEIFIDDSETQTIKIHQMQREKYYPGLRNEYSGLGVWVAAQKLLKSYRVVIPFANYIKFPTKPLRMRRDFPRFLTLIEVSANLHQYQRKKEIINGVECVIASLEDYAVAYGLASVILERAIKQISPKAEELIVGISKSDELKDNVFGQAEVQKCFDWNVKTIRKYLRECAGMGLLEVAESTKGKATKYKFIRLPSAQDTLLVNPEALKQLLEEEPAKLTNPDQNAIGQVSCKTDKNLTEVIRPDHKTEEALFVGR